MAISEESILRQQTVTAGSKQPRLHREESSGGFFTSTYNWVTRAHMEEPPYIVDSRRRDAWLMNFWRHEPHLAGVVSSVVQIDKNRGWTLLGGRNTVAHYEKVMRYADGGAGWRSFVGKQSLAFNASDIGANTETERDGFAGRLLNLYSVDPTRARLRGGELGKLNYFPQGQVPQDWFAYEQETVDGRLIQSPADYFRCASLQSVLEGMNGLGFCAISRAILLAQIMVAVINHDKEKLGAQAPQGLMLLHNITEDQWLSAMDSRKAKLQGREEQWFSGVAVIATSGIDEAKAVLTALSTLPDNFNRENFIEFLMYGYALCFGYDSAEFWPKMRAGLGSGAETQVTALKATGKGGREFVTEFQTQMQLQLPPSVAFRFDYRDESGDLLAVEVEKAKVDLITKLYQTGLQMDAPLITREQALELLARSGIIPDGWTLGEEPTVTMDDLHVDEAVLAGVKADDTQSLRYIRNMVREFPEINRVICSSQDEPIVYYEWPSRRSRVVWDSGWHANRPASWAGANVSYDIAHGTVGIEATRSKAENVRRPSIHRAVLAEEDDVIIDDEDVDEAIEIGGDRLGDEWEEILEAEEE